VYKAKFPDGTTEEYAANVIAKNIYAQVDDKGRQYNVLSELIDHRKNSTAMMAEEDSYNTTQGHHYPKQTIMGWEIRIKWKDGLTSWEYLKNLKEANLVKTSKYVITHSLASGPTFAKLSQSTANDVSMRHP
jgi:hypothetical protein